MRWRTILMLSIAGVVTLGLAISWRFANRCALGYVGPTGTSISHDDIRFLAVVPVRNMVVTANTMGECKVWEQDSFRLVKSFTLQTEIASLAASSDGRYVVAGTDTTTLIDTAEWAVQELGVSSLYHRFLEKRPACLAVVDSSEHVRVYDTSIPGKYTLLDRPGKLQVTSLATAKTRNYVAAGHRGGSIIVWNADNGKIVMETRAVTDKVRSLLFVSEDSQLVSGDSDGKVALWELKSGQKLAERRCHLGSISGLKPSPFGDFFFSAGFDYSIQAWEASSLSRCWRIKTSDLTSPSCMDVAHDKGMIYYGLPTGSVFTIQIVHAGVPHQAIGR